MQFALERKGGTILNSENAYLKRVHEVPREFIVIGLNGEVSGDQIGFNTDTGKWYRNGIEYTDVDRIDLSKAEKFEVIWDVPSADVDIHSPDYVSSVGYKVGNSTIVAKVLSDGLVDFKHIIRKPKVTVSSLLEKEEEEEKKKKKTTTKKKVVKKKVETKAEKK